MTDDEGKEHEVKPVKDVSSKTESFLPLKALIYAPAGAGKTTFLSTAIGDHRFMPMLICDFEGGVRSIASVCRQVKVEDLAKREHVTDKIDVVRIGGMSDFDRVYDLLSGPNNGYRTVAIDSLSEFNYLNLTSLVESEKMRNPRHDVEVPEIGDYGRNAIQIKRMIRFFRDLDMNVIFTAIAAEYEDAKTKKSQYRPAFTGKLISEIPGIVDVLGYFAVVDDVEEDEEGKPVEVQYRALICKPSEKFMAKARVDVSRPELPDLFRNPTLPELLDAVG